MGGIREEAKSLGIKSCWSIPIYSEGETTLGTFAISHSQIRHPTNFDLQLLETASYLAGIAIQSVQGRKELKKSEDRYRDLYDSAPLAYITSEMDGSVTNANLKAEQLLGYDKETLLSLSVLDFPAPGEHGLEKAQKLLKLTQEGQEVEGEHIEMKRRDGTHIWVSLTVRLYRDAQGNPIERRGILLDITDQKKIVEKLRLSKFVLDHAGDAVLWAGPDKQILYANEEAYRSLGYSPGELIGKPISDISPFHEPQQFKERLQHCQKNSPIQYESFHRTKEGKLFPIEITLSALEHDQKMYTCAIVRDTTERKRREALLNGQKATLEMIATGQALQDILAHICQMIENPSEGIVLHNSSP